MSKNLIKQLKKLKYGEINPAEDWVIKNRSILLAQIKNTLPATNAVSSERTYFLGISHIFKTALSFRLVRPLMIMLTALFIIPTVWVARGLAQGDSLPGDTLYSAKRAVEKTQVAFVSLVGDKNKEVQLHLDLAQRRAYEVQKVIDDPERKMRVDETVGSLKDELNIVNQKLTDFKNKPATLSSSFVNNVQKQTGEIKTTLQEVKQTLQVRSSTVDRDLTKEVALAKDLTKEVDFNTLDVIITSHLNGNTAVSKDDVSRIVDASFVTAVLDLDNSQQDVDGVKTVVDSVKSELSKEFASSTKKAYNVISTSTKELTEKISNVALETSQAASDTRAVSIGVDRKIAEAKTLLSSGDLTAVVNKIKEVNQATKEAEKISETTLQKVQTVFPLVQVIKVKESDHSGVIINSSTIFISSTPNEATSSLFSTTTPSSTSTVTKVVPAIRTSSASSTTSSATTTVK